MQFGFKISIVDFDHPTIRPTDKPEGLTGIRRRTPIRVAPGSAGRAGPLAAPTTRGRGRGARSPRAGTACRAEAGGSRGVGRDHQDVAGLAVCWPALTRAVEDGRGALFPASSRSVFARLTAHGVWLASRSDVLGCFLLASRGSRARAVGSPARRATRAGGAHADAARAGAGGELLGMCRLPCAVLESLSCATPSLAGVTLR